jgi:hypothetical protein
LLFNVSGILLIYPIAAVRRIPLRLAMTLTQVAFRSRKMMVVWVVAMFYGIPSLVLVVSRWLN